MPRVSIIITCYNLGAYLEEALTSALNQTYTDFEVILVDDGSTDPATIALLDRLPAHPSLRVLRTANQGVARARNCGITAASGDYILPLDADDRILQGYLAHTVPVLDQRPEVGFVGCHYRTFGEREVECRPDCYEMPCLLIENTVPIASLFRRTCWEQIGGYSPDIPIEDWDLWLSILECGYLGVVIPEVFFEYRVRANSRNGANQQSQMYQHTWQLLYDRHRMSYERYCRDVILGQVNLYTTALASQNWLEGQVANLRNAVQEQLQMITALQTIADARADWIVQIEAARDYHAHQSSEWQLAAEQQAAALLQEQGFWQLPWYKRLKRCLAPGKFGDGHTEAIEHSMDSRKQSERG